MTPEELKLSEISAELTLADKGLTRERVMILTGRPVRPPRIIGDAPRPSRAKPRPVKAVSWGPCDAAPTTPSDRHGAAVKAVELTRSGLSARAALSRAGLSEAYATAVHACLAAKGDLWDAAEAENISSKRNNGICFVRWFRRLPPINGADSPDNDKLRKALCQSNLRPKELALKTGIHITAIFAFRAGKQKRMRAETRQKLWAVLDRGCDL